MKARIVWIDWAKALAVMTVVFCHLPQSQEFFYYRYLQATIITVFFFLSGYLKKDRNTKENWQKYWWGLIVPYLLYNAIFYPYWFTRYFLQNGAWPDFFQAIRPVIGALLGEHESWFAEPLNGPLWYLPAILIMHITIDLCRRTRHLHQFMITLCILSVFAYAANKYWNYAPYLTPMGILRRLPYYYLGYVLGRKQILEQTIQGFQKKSLSVSKYLLFSVLCFSASLLFFHWHLQVMDTNFPLHILLFYPVNFCFLFGVIYLCKSLNGYCSAIITNLSIGTLVIIGLHTIAIGIFNQVHHLLNTSWSPIIGYQWHEALTITIFICTILYQFIIWFFKKLPQMLGKNING